MSEDELMSAVQAAEYLGVIRQRVYDLASRGRMGRRVGNLWLFSKAELDAYKAERANKPKGGRPKHEAGTLTAAGPA